MSSLNSQTRPAGGHSLRRALGIIGVIYFTRFLILGCSPYPVYNHSGGPPPNDTRVVSIDLGDKDDSDNVRFEDEPINQPAESRIDPVIFSRVVKDYLGMPYKLGGDGTDGIDCSYLVTSIYRDYDGQRLPPNTRDLIRTGQRVPADRLEVGDLIFFSFNGASVSHVGIYLGDGKFVHASESRGVIISSFREQVYQDHYVGARRVQ